MKFILNKKYQFGGTMGGGSYTVPISTPVPIQRAVNTNVPIATYVKPMPTANRDAFAVDEDLFKAAGLTAETSNYLQLLKEAKAEIDSLSDLEIITQTDKFKQAVAKFNKYSSHEYLNALRRNEDILKEAEPFITTNGSAGAIVTTQGKVRVKVKDEKTGKYKYGFVSLDEYSLNREKYEPITASEQVRLRNDVELFDNTGIEAIKSTYGLPKILSTIQSEFIKDAGESGWKEFGDTIAEFAEAGGAKGIITDSGFYKNNKKALQQAFQSVQNYLDPDMMNQLKIQAVERAAREGKKYNSKESLEAAALLEIEQYINRATKSDGGKGQKYNISMSDLNGGSGGSRGDTKIGYYELLARGLGGQTKNHKLLDGKYTHDGYAVEYKGTFKDYSVKINDGESTITKEGLFTDSTLNTFVDPKRAKIIKGNIPLTQDQINKMVVAEGGQIVTWAEINPLTNEYDLASKEVHQQITSQVDAALKAEKAANPNATTNWEKRKSEIYEDISKQTKYVPVVVTEVYYNEDDEAFSELNNKLDSKSRSDVSSDISNRYNQIFYNRIGSESDSDLFTQGDWQKTVMVAPVTSIIPIRNILDNNSHHQDKSESDVATLQESTSIGGEPEDFYGSEYSFGLDK